MASKRAISSSIWEDEFIGILNNDQRVLWIGLFSSLADDQGRLVDNPILISSKVFPYDNPDPEDIDKDLSVFEEEEKILRYQVGKKKYIQILNWWEHQKPQWAMPSKFPAPDGWLDAIRTRLNGEYVEENWKSGGFLVTQPQVNPQGEDTSLQEVEVARQDQDQDPVKDPIKEEKLNGTSADAEPPEPPPKKPKKGKKRDPLLDHPAIIAYQEEVRLHVPITWREEVCNTVDDPERWKKLVHDWIGHGWNKQNIKGLLQAYRNGGIDKRRDEPAGFDAIRSYRQKQGLDNG